MQFTKRSYQCFQKNNQPISSLFHRCLTMQAVPSFIDVNNILTQSSWIFVIFMMPRIIHKSRNSFKNGTDEEKMETALQYKKPDQLNRFVSCKLILHHVNKILYNNTDCRGPGLHRWGRKCISSALKTKGKLWHRPPCQELTVHAQAPSVDCTECRATSSDFSELPGTDISGTHDDKKNVFLLFFF